MTGLDWTGLDSMVSAAAAAACGRSEVLVAPHARIRSRRLWPTLGWSAARPDWPRPDLCEWRCTESMPILPKKVKERLMERAT